MGNRMSSLPVAQRCGRAAELSSRVSTTAALLGTAWHAHRLQPDSDAARVAMAKLEPEEREQVLSWKLPPDTETPHGVLRFADALVELELGLDANGEHCDPSSPDCISIGHLDFAWIMGDTAYVVDAKKSEFTTADGPDTLQLKSYALALASKHGCRYFVTGQWACIEGRYWWADHPVDMWSREADEARALVVAAALNVGGSYVVGSHCRSCYGRGQCPGWLLPPELAESQLGPLTRAEEPSEADMLALLTLTQRLEDTVSKAKERCKQWALDHGGIVDPSTKKRWCGVAMPGRSTLNEAALVADGIDVAKYKREGKPYPQMRWVNAK